MRRIWIVTGFVCLLVSMPLSYGQKIWTLEECITYAHDNNLQVKRQALKGLLFMTLEQHVLQNGSSME